MYLGSDTDSVSDIECGVDYEYYVEESVSIENSSDCDEEYVQALLVMQQQLSLIADFIGGWVGGRLLSLFLSRLIGLPGPFVIHNPNRVAAHQLSLCSLQCDILDRSKSHHHTISNGITALKAKASRTGFLYLPAPTM